MNLKPMKPKKCSICKLEFVQRNSLQKVCTRNNYACAKVIGPKMTASKAKTVKTVQNRELKQAKEALRTKGYYMRRAQFSANAFARARDRKIRPFCISCGKPAQPGDHAGHFRPTTHAPTRLQENNIHLQCVQCNLFLRGNLVLYKENLTKLIGIDAVDEILSNHPPAKFTIDDLKTIDQAYKAKLKALQAL